MTPWAVPSILDVTLRDGSYAIDYRFTPLDAARIVAELYQSGIELIEIGHGCGLGARENLRIDAAASDFQYVRAARAAAPRARLGVIAGPYPVTTTKNIDAVIEDLDFIRFAANCDKPKKVEANLSHARRRKPGLLIFFQMMRSTRLKAAELLQSARQVADMGADAVYLVDTAGHFMPDEVRETVALLASELKIKVGFHGHNNLDLAVANSLAAVEAGASYVDASLKGMGRSAGNAVLEVLVSLLKRKGMLRHVNLDRLVDAGETLIAPIMPPRKGISGIDMITADANIDLYPLEQYRALAESYGFGFLEFIRLLGADEKVIEVGQMEINRLLLRNPDRLRAAASAPAALVERISAAGEKRVKVLVALKASPGPGECPRSLIEALGSEFPEADIYFAPFHPERIEHLADAEIFFSFILTPQLLKGAEKLRWFHSFLIGAEHYSFSGLLERRITVTVPRGAYSVPVAESALALMLALARKTGDCVRMQEKRIWGTEQYRHAVNPAQELSSSVVTIIGFGGIGRETALRCAAFGMKVQVVLPSERPLPPHVERFFLTDALDEALSSSDFVVLACPLTEGTKNLIDARRIACMKKSAYLINIARGALIDEAALLDALRTGKIAGAGLDVFVQEPLPSSHPFYDLANVVMTPHVAGWSTHIWERAFLPFRENMRRYIAGESLQDVYDHQKGY